MKLTGCPIVHPSTTHTQLALLSTRDNKNILQTSSVAETSELNTGDFLTYPVGQGVKKTIELMRIIHV
uniref:Uncharacterized protein n=1 Tax=Kalanchoe fedtschenkoi TaxID=63787 RepID=A0A7N1A353_KALFE